MFSALADASTTSQGPFTQTVFLAIVAALVLWLVVYLAYKVWMTSRRDFGVPVRRRLLARKLTVHEDQRADVPFWWTDLQVQRAVRSHWKRSLRAPASSSDRA